jgi:hypothetical protein
MELIIITVAGMAVAAGILLGTRSEEGERIPVKVRDRRDDRRRQN